MCKLLNDPNCVKREWECIYKKQKDWCPILEELNEDLFIVMIEKCKKTDSHPCDLNYNCPEIKEPNISCDNCIHEATFIDYDEKPIKYPKWVPRVSDGVEYGTVEYD